MKNKKIIATIFVLMGLIISNASIVSATDPTVTLDPSQPEPKSTVTFTASVDIDDVSEVRLLISECNVNTGICFSDSNKNLSMAEVSDGQYEATTALTHDDATYVQYTLLVKTDAGWTKYLEETKVNLKLSDNNGGNTNNGSPGFEIIGFIFSAMFILAFYNKRKRKK